MNNICILEVGIDQKIQSFRLSVLVFDFALFGHVWCTGTFPCCLHLFGMETQCCDNFYLCFNDDDDDDDVNLLQQVPETFERSPTKLLTVI